MHVTLYLSNIHCPDIKTKHQCFKTELDGFESTGHGSVVHPKVLRVFKHHFLTDFVLQILPSKISHGLREGLICVPLFPPLCIFSSCRQVRTFGSEQHESWGAFFSFYDRLILLEVTVWLNIGKEMLCRIGRRWLREQKDTRGQGRRMLSALWEEH